MSEAGAIAAAGCWDAVVIGAGPAGSVCAYALARAGQRVLLVDRAHMPRAKVCGCCLAPDGAQSLARAGLAAVLNGAGVIDACELRVGSRSVTLPARGFAVLGRDEFDARLAAAAQAAGATLLTGWGAHVEADGTVRLRKAGGERVPHIAESTSHEPAFAGLSGPLVRARAVVVADGIGGASLAHRPEFGWRVSPASFMGLGAILSRPPVALRSGHMTMLCGAAGYLGLVRLPTGMVDAAASLDPHAVRATGGPAKVCAAMLTSAGGDPTALDGAVWRGTPLLTRRRSRIESDNVFVLGDAAGYVEPFTGEGMSWAIRGALIASTIICNRIDGRSEPGAWALAHRREIGRHHRRCGFVARLVRRHSALRALVGAGTWGPSIFNRVVSMLGPAGPAAVEGRYA